MHLRLSSDDVAAVLKARKGHEKAVKFLEAQRGREEKKTVRKGPKPKGDSVHSKETPSGGNEASYLLRRLARLGDDWMDRYEAGEFASVRQAAIAAGIVKVPTALDRLHKLWAKLTPAERAQFVRLIGVTIP